MPDHNVMFVRGGNDPAPPHSAIVMTIPCARTDRVWGPLACMLLALAATTTTTFALPLARMDNGPNGRMASTLGRQRRGASQMAQA